ncbi:DUF6443 domain-containing protein [Pedobacter hiemivivus]|uniref:RHS repeat-associated core domain-containing protein n=1 Tax=Pedobacter hiemivivus TaxID=2530454 RepID=A0A4V2MKE4_9SPHI|nr:DUF6443 domain-containing protein [Pedobacter hiemivivus]TCC97706.1 RHS repeat-associated core domain-containing protein [Pedobacter hiemivivus]
MIKYLLILVIGLHTLITDAFCQHLTFDNYANQSEITASGSITFTSGFHVAAGSNFRAYISVPVINYCMPLGTVPSVGRNYQLVSTIKKSGVTSPEQLLGLNACELSQTIKYLDGLGRPIQTVQVKGSPSLKDLVFPVVYDTMGREPVKYLPYADEGTPGGSYRSNALTAGQGVFAFYNPAGGSGPQQANGVVRNPFPFAETVFEASPLNRVEQQGAPGASWQISAGHTQRIVYGSNTTQSGNYGVKLYRAAAGTDHIRTLIDGGWYAVGQLILTITKDENWTVADGQTGTVEEYKNNEGQVVLKRYFNRRDDNSIESLSTYYVYDDFGNLSFVLPPGAEPDSGLPDSTVLASYCYQYSYDGFGRLIEKKLPGVGLVALVYNKRDQLVLSQNANQLGRQEWNFMRYDALGRTIMTGILTNGGSRAALQAILELETVMWDKRDNTLNYGYTTNSYPSGGFSPLTISYYDDYDFPGNSFGQPGVGEISGDYVRGQLTGKKIWTLESTPKVLLSVNCYDDKNRLITLKSTNHLGGTDIQKNTYDFIGELLNTTRTHIVNGVSTVIANRYDYNHAGRKLRSYQKINSDDEVLLSENIYNELGQLIEKKLHDGLQQSRYAYNERGWLKESISNQFSLKLGYDTLSSPQYNGNIATQEWGAAYNNKYLYSYDKLNRLKSGVSSGIVMSEVLSYDKMGNISSLLRDGGSPNVYSYSGNKLNGITGGLNTGIYEYDNNGNAVKDGRNGAVLEYNLLNLPRLVNKDGEGNIVYNYDAVGNKLRKVSGGMITDYVSGIQYLNGAIDFIQTEEGLARRNGNGYTYEYTLSDHLGNTRATFYKNPSTGVLEVLQKDDYYSFGLRKQSLAASNDNKYLYNGKELQEELGQLDYGARFYDPVIGRWNVVDPLAEKFQSLSPYNYTDNNPVNNTDPDGMDILYGQGVGGGDLYTGADAQALFGQLKASQQGDQDDKKKKEKPKSEQLLDGLVSGLKDLANALAPIRPATEDDPQSLSEWWDGIKSAPSNISDIYSDGSLEDKTRLTASLIGLFRGKKPSVSGVMLAGAKGGSKLLYFGKIAVNRDVFHRVIKKEILRNAGDFVKKVGGNPDVGVVGGNIQLIGNGPYKGKTFQTTLKASEYLK